MNSNSPDVRTRDFQAGGRQCGVIVITGSKGYHQIDRYSCGAAVVAAIHASVTGTVCAESYPRREYGTPTFNVFGPHVD